METKTAISNWWLEQHQPLLPGLYCCCYNSRMKDGPKKQQLLVLDLFELFLIHSCLGNLPCKSWDNDFQQLQIKKTTNRVI